LMLGKPLPALFRRANGMFVIKSGRQPSGL
jgi:hypothetical protein